MLSNRHIPVDEPIDLLNVAFENPRKIKLQAEGNPGGIPKKEKKARARKAETKGRLVDTSYMVPDRVTGLQEVEELRRLCPDRVWNFVSLCLVSDSTASDCSNDRSRSMCHTRFVERHERYSLLRTYFS